MKLKHIFSFEFRRSGISGSVVTVTVFTRKRFWHKWKKVDEYKAACTGFNVFTGAEWTGPNLRRIPVQTECEINSAAQVALNKGRANA